MRQMGLNLVSLLVSPFARETLCSYISYGSRWLNIWCRHSWGTVLMISICRSFLGRGGYRLFHWRKDLIRYCSRWYADSLPQSSSKYRKGSITGPKPLAGLSVIVAGYSRLSLSLLLLALYYHFLSTIILSRLLLFSPLWAEPPLSLLSSHLDGRRHSYWWSGLFLKLLWVPSLGWQWLL